MSKVRECWDLFRTFAGIGAVTFGGGYAMLPILQREVVEKRHWATEEELMDYYAIGQCTPGVIAVNTATFIGNKRCGIAGGIAATLGVVTPSVIIITVIAMFLRNFAHLAVVKHAFAGIRACVTVLIFDAVIKLGKKSMKDYRSVIIFLVALGISMFTKISPALIVIAAGLAGFLVAPRSTKALSGKSADGAAAATETATAAAGNAGTGDAGNAGNADTATDEEQKGGRA